MPRGADRGHLLLSPSNRVSITSPSPSPRGPRGSGVVENDVALVDDRGPGLEEVSPQQLRVQRVAARAGADLAEQRPRRSGGAERREQLVETDLVEGSSRSWAQPGSSRSRARACAPIVRRHLVLRRASQAGRDGPRSGRWPPRQRARAERHWEHPAHRHHRWPSALALTLWLRGAGARRRGTPTDRRRARQLRAFARSVRSGRASPVLRGRPQQSRGGAPAGPLRSRGRAP